MFHSGPRETFVAIATRGSVMSLINDALNKGVSIAGASMAIVFNGIPAEIYQEPKKSLWKKLFS